VRFGYCHIKRVKTGPYPALSVVLEKAEGFEEQQEAFQVQIEERNTERRIRKEREEKEAEEAREREEKEEEQADEKEAEGWKGETEKVVAAEAPEADQDE
jgi:hypothetical protein